MPSAERRTIPPPRLLLAAARAYDPDSRLTPAFVADLPANRGATPSPSARPTSDEREHVVELLSQHFAEDRLSIEEFEQRVTLVYAASDRAALQALVSDVQPASVDAGDAHGNALRSPGEAPTHERVRAVMSHTARSGPLAMPRHLEVRATMGNIELDLRSATFATGVTVIDVRALLGNVEITVLPDVPVEIVGDAMLGTFHMDTRHAQPAASPQRRPMLLRVTGRSVLANVEVRHARAAEPIDGW